MQDKFPIPEIKNDHIVEQFARSLFCHYRGEAWKFEPSLFEENIKAMSKEIVCSLNSHTDLWNVCAAVANFLSNPIALDGSTVSSLHYLAEMANRALEKAKTYV